MLKKIKMKKINSGTKVKPGIGIVGHGRFGKLLAQILSPDFPVTVFVRPGSADGAQAEGGQAVGGQTDGRGKTGGVGKSDGGNPAYKITTDITSFYAGSNVVFFAVPIPSFESVILQQRKYFRAGQLLIDVLSVKLHAKNIFDKYLPKGWTLF
jgi:prephenate dehydrogenase